MIGDRGRYTVTYPIPFPNAVLNVFSQNNSSENDQYMNATRAYNLNKNNFVLFQVGAACSFYWMAIGY